MPLDADAADGASSRARGAARARAPGGGGAGRPDAASTPTWRNDPRHDGRARPRPARVLAGGLRRRRPAARRRGRRDARDARGDRAAAPGPHVGARPAGLRPALRRIATEFMVECAVDAERVCATSRGWTAEVRGALRARRRGADATSSSSAPPTCRYVGQGYELRVPVDAAGSPRRGLAAFHAPPSPEYGHDFPGNPIELVAVRVTGIGPRPTRRARSGRGHGRRRRRSASATSSGASRRARRCRADLCASALPRPASRSRARRSSCRPTPRWSCRRATARRPTARATCRSRRGGARVSADRSARRRRPGCWAARCSRSPWRWAGGWRA